jgi:hypothetical protein
METLDVLTELDPIINRVPSDFGGGSPRNKLLLMCYLTYRYRLKTYVEIGVYRGRSLFPVAYTIKKNQGMAYGIDPYCREMAFEHDVSPELRTALTKFIGETDYDAIYEEVEALRSDFALANNCQIYRKTSQSAASFFSQNRIPIDMLHIDGNHDTCFVKADVAMYLPLVSSKGFIIMDDIDWESVKPAYTLALKKTTLVLEAKSFAILFKQSPDIDVERLRFELLTLHRLFLASEEHEK